MAMWELVFDGNSAVRGFNRSCTQLTHNSGLIPASRRVSPESTISELVLYSLGEELLPGNRFAWGFFVSLVGLA